MPSASRTFTKVIIVLGLGIMIPALLNWQCANPIQYAAYFTLALLAAGLKVGWRSEQGIFPMSLMFVFVAVVSLSMPEALLLGAAVAVVSALQVDARTHRAERSLFAMGSISIAITLADFVLRDQTARLHLKQAALSQAVVLLLAGTCFYVGQTFPAAMRLSIESGQVTRKVWRDRFLWMLPYYIACAMIAGLFERANHEINWQIPVLLMPVAYLLYRSYRLYMQRLESERSHAEDMSSLHLRTIEALALAIDAKDHNTHDHLQRVQVYALEVAKELGLSRADVEALRAASLLHDIGKLAVPEHIISKPGKLTPEEFEKMKIHPVVGAEILERVRFPYPVVPIVRSHHEKWNGSGYPDGLIGESIPIGARILSAVDCLDALASDRPYRRALPLDQAVSVVVQEAGKSFDPRVVEILARRYVELERQATSKPTEPLKLSRDLKIEAGAAPMAGFEVSEPPPPPPVKDGDGQPAPPPEFLAQIAAARQEAQALFELVQNLGSSLSLDDTLSVLASRIKRLVPYDAMSVYLRHGEVLIPEFVSGDNFRIFASLQIPLGQGLSGWVAEKGKPILNGNPSVEPGYTSDSMKFSTLRSAVAVPLEGLSGVVGVLALYHTDRDAFTRDHLRILQAVSSKLSLAVENALLYRQAETSATTDFLTELPNARSLFVHLDGELSRCKRTKLPLAMMVCDLDNFKDINDRHGHLEGNKVLKAVAQALRSGCREYDYVARMGGDEFVVVLPGLEPGAVEARAAQFRISCAEKALEETGFEVTVSIGSASYPVDGDDAEDLLAAADRRMYKAKRANPRNGVSPVEEADSTSTKPQETRLRRAGGTAWDSPTTIQ